MEWPRELSQGVYSVGVERLEARENTPERIEEFLGRGRSWSCSKGENPLKEWRSPWKEGGVGPVAKEIAP
jgi:hypothetical protein